jgi:hypothetical protein
LGRPEASRDVPQFRSGYGEFYQIAGMFCSEREVIQIPGYLSPATLLPFRTRSEYLESAAHYEGVARRILVALRGSSQPLVLVTGDPPPDPEGISEALGKVMAPGNAPIIISCRPELRPADLDRTIPLRPAPSAHASSVFIFYEVDQLSDTQIKSIFETHDQNQRAAILLALTDFLDRLERPALRFLNDRMTAQIRFQEIGDDEAIAFLHNQLLSQADRRVEARGFRRGILVGLAAGGAALAAVIAAFVLHPTSEQVYEMPGSAGPSRPPGENALMLQPVEEAKMTAAPAERAASVEATSANRAAPPQLTAPPTRAEDPSEVAVQSAERPPASRPPATEASALLARGDALLGTGDITSARLFYERAADAGSGLAALRLGATFEPLFPGRAGIGAATDPAQALFWYRRARDLGVAEAEARITRLDPGSAGHSR